MSESIHILSCDTSTKACSVAIHRNGILLSTLEHFSENSHAENLTLLIQKNCVQSNLKLSQIDAFAIAQGPGSYTGLRIGSSTLKGLCYALGKPLIAISTLRLMAEGLISSVDSETMVCPMIDARRMEVYCAVYDSKGNTICSEQPLEVDENSFSDLLVTHKILFAGNGAEKCRSLFTSPNASFLTDYFPLAKNMGKLALEAFTLQKFEDVAYFEPEYLKEFYTTAKIVS